MRWNLSHRISKFFLRLEDWLNGQDRRVLLFDIESYDPRRIDHQFDFPPLGETLVISGRSYNIPDAAVDLMMAEPDEEVEPEGGTRHVPILRAD